MLNLVVRTVATVRSENYEASKTVLELPYDNIEIFLFYFEMFNTRGKRRVEGGDSVLFSYKILVRNTFSESLVYLHAKLQI